MERLTRRGASRKGALALAGAALLLTEPNQAFPQETEETPEFENIGVNWSELFDLNNQLAQASGRRPREVATSLAPKLKELAEYLQPQLRHSEQEINLVEATKDDPKGVYQYYKRMLGGMYPGLLTPEEVIPFYVEKADIAAWASEIKDAYARAIRTPALIDRANRRGNYPVYEWVDAALDFAKENYANKPEVCKGDVVIEVDPDIKTTPEGRRLTEQHRKTIEKFVQTAAFFSTHMCNKIVLSSSDYGERQTTEAPDQAGLFSSHKNPTRQIHMGEIWINMDHGTNDEQPVEQTFSHEAYGHGSDISLNKGLQQQLPSEKVVERQKFQGEILENPDFGANDASLQQILKRRSAYSDVIKRVKEGKAISTDEFMTLITDYPRNVMFYNDFRQDKETEWMNGIFDTVMGLPQDDPILGETRLEGDKWYETYDDFLKDYKPILIKDAQNGNLRAKAILWGIDNLGSSLRNYGMLWSSITDPTNDYHYVPSDNDKRATTWTNYFTVLALTGIMYHGFINGIAEIVNLVNDKDQKLFATEVFYIRQRHREELWADGTGWDHYLGNRLIASPYRRGKEHLAYLLSQRQ